MEEDSGRSLHKRLRDEQDDDDAEDEGQTAVDGMIRKRTEAGGLIVVHRRR